MDIERASVQREPWRPQAQTLADELERQLGTHLVGVYVHGSAALGGWVPTSDLDMLAVVDDHAARNWGNVGSQLLTAALSTPAVELSIVTREASLHPAPPWPFLVHVAQRDGKVVVDAGHGDVDLVLHYLVARHGALTLVGTSGDRIFGVVPRALVLPHLLEELTWGVDHADAKYAVLNACRALAYAVDGKVLSKLEGGHWALGLGHDTATINRALEAQTLGLELGPVRTAERHFVDNVRSNLVSFQPVPQLTVVRNTFSRRPSCGPRFSDRHSYGTHPAAPVRGRCTGLASAEVRLKGVAQTAIEPEV